MNVQECVGGGREEGGRREERGGREEGGREGGGRKENHMYVCGCGGMIVGGGRDVG